MRCAAVLLMVIFGCGGGEAGSQSRAKTVNVSSVWTNHTVERQGRELDFLLVLNITSALRGVRQCSGPLMHVPAWKLHAGFNNVLVPSEAAQGLLGSVKKGLSAFFVFKANKKSIGTLFSVHLPGKTTPLLRATLNPRTSQFVLSYTLGTPEETYIPRDYIESDFEDEAVEDHATYDSIHHLRFDIPPKVLHDWTWLAVTVTSDVAVVFVNCRAKMEAKMGAPAKLQFPSESLIYFRQEPGVKKKLLGSVQVAQMFPGILRTRLWHCENGKPSLTGSDTEDLDDKVLMDNTTQYLKLQSMFHPKSAPKKRSITMTDLDSENALADQPRSSKRDSCQMHLSTMENLLEKLGSDLFELKKENERLSKRLNDVLERCEPRSKCHYDGRYYSEGETWYSDVCTICRCDREEVRCQIDTRKPGCLDPCTTSPPCLNGGSCRRTGQTYVCQCHPSFTGEHCEYPINICVHPQEYGECSDNIPRWFFNMISQQCEQFQYSGCGRSVNNFATSQDCQNACGTGACCFRHGSKFGVPRTPDRAIVCKKHSYSSCQKLCFSAEVEVVAFYPGRPCESDHCETPIPEGCTVGSILHPPHSAFTLGCNLCTCHGSFYSCRCRDLQTRKEIRDMTSAEVLRFQTAVSWLRLSGPNNAWEQFRDLHVNHVMHVYSNPFFLPWNRLFLRRLEQHLQDFDCQITLPYFDFTTESGNMAHSLLWQPNYFGGDGEGADGCVPDHPFRGENFTEWWPCLRRKFNTNIPIPTMIDAALALTTDDFYQFTEHVKTFTHHLHSFIGGDMETSASPYDPIFYAIHSYIDMLYWKWQKKQQSLGKATFPLQYADVLMIPFNVPPRDVLDSEGSLCISYAPPSHGRPCNFSENEFGPDGFDVDGYDRQGFDRDGYDRAEYDRSGYDRNGRYDGRNHFPFNGFDAEGYDRDGYDRRGYNRHGFDKNGYNRECIDIYGYDCDGFNRYGLNRTGHDRFGVDHNRDRNHPTIRQYYDVNGLTINCLDFDGLTVDGFDRYGFNTRHLDSRGCTCGNNGPFVLIVAYKIQEILDGQTEDFLKTLAETCPQTSHRTSLWGQQTWNTLDTSLSELIPNRIDGRPKSVWSKQFCFDADSFLSFCPCQSEKVATCRGNPEVEAPCSLHPDARSVMSFCDTCDIKWHVDGRQVECKSPEIVDYCVPNPCLNGGVCVPSRWESEPEAVSCQCAPGFEGPHCEYHASWVCHLPLDHGTDKCGEKSQRWRYDQQSFDCKPFTYNGCSGNSNNFQSYYDCRVRCMIGACCWRQQLFPDRLYGYDSDGYDRYGFNVKGVDREGKKRGPQNSFGGDFGLYSDTGFDYQGYDRAGFNLNDLDRHGYNRRGHHQTTGFNLSGFNSFGDYDGIIDYDNDGYDRDGFNRAGFNCHGYSRDGWNYYGLCAGWTYGCRAMSLADCQRVELEYPHLKQEVLSFTPGKRCEEVQCEEQCGCDFMQKSYKFGEKVDIGCTSCECRESGRMVCSCNTVYTRKEIRDLTASELNRFQEAIKQLQTSTGHPSRWQNLTSLYARHFPQSHGDASSLPWHRFFLRLVEMELQQSDCAVSIPYFDWTMDVGSLETSVVWQANYFGGNGNESAGDCVRNHPFKDYNLPYWTPCLRRRFNTLISLPDAVNLRFILNEPRYEDFRIQLEAASSLFHLFVGGHMSSSECAYDPIFLVHYAFIDKLWTDWEQLQLKDPTVQTAQYLDELRYIPMVPFGVTPDDVLLSDLQMCVIYTGPTEGAPCNVSSTEDDHNWSSIYDIDGINKYGYSRTGHDAMGWNPYGFGRDNFNRDGYTSLGFDRQGYNRYGFDANGCTRQNFCINERANAPFPETFDAEEYDKYGYNPFGFDRRGLDVYGFDSRGFDKDECSFFHNGPFYPTYKKWVDEQLVNLPNKQLVNIERICPPVSPVPEWWLATMWCSQNGLLAAVRDYEDNILVQHPYAGSYIPYGTLHNELLPASPDERFCFQLHFHSGCNLGYPPVTCPVEQCSSGSCSGFPDAKCQPSNCGSCDSTYVDVQTGETVDCFTSECRDENGVVRAEGDVWQERHCETCMCSHGQVVCSRVDCRLMTPCEHPVMLPDQCCPRCEGCSYKGRDYSNGVHFVPVVNPCLQCLCSNGTVTCSQVACPPLTWCHPQSIVILPSQCCPVCTMCGSHKDGSRWREGPCQICTCKAGTVECTTETCPSISCSHPSKPPGHCCELCSDCEYNGQRVRNGGRFRPDVCSECECKDGNVNCQQTVCPAVRCLRPVSREGECCPVCPTECEYEGSVHKSGSTFISRVNPCLDCFCENTQVKCRRRSCPDLQLPCKNPITLPGGCCPSVCPTCVVNGKEYEQGQQWTVEENCQACICMEGAPICKKHPMCSRHCTHGIVTPEICCSPCTDCLFENKLVPNGMQFSPTGDACTVCRCSNGNVTCSRTRPTCPKLPCQKTEIHEESCCPVCQSCTGEFGRHIDHGRQWINPSDSCQQCTCQEGAIRCNRIQCEIKCTHPIKRTYQCCPECDGCQYEDRLYHNGAVVPTSDSCAYCRCRSGSVECEKKQCRPVTCLKPKNIPGECCPVCEECVFRGKTYSNGLSFIPPSDPCFNCSCQMGTVDCQRIDQFCNPQCTHPERISGQCCPVCDGCEHERRNYKNGQKFHPAHDTPCLECLCLNGRVTCSMTECQPLPCPEPVTHPDKCCPECPPSCAVAGRVHPEGSTWPDPNDECQECTCMHSRIHCKRRQCPKAQCLHPAAPYGECCPLCNHCEFTRRLYRNGQQFVHVDDPCQECICQNGTVTCRTVTCGPLKCSKPVGVPHQCCPMCPKVAECHYNNRTYQPQQTFLHESDECQECVCMEGDAVCHKIPCPEANCPNAVQGPCCESCSGCSYGGRSFPNRQTFTDPLDSCRDCRCDDGHVVCQQHQCPRVTCKNTIVMEDECCPICKDCLYGNQLFGDGEIFVDPQDSCKECRCNYPRVVCEPRVCPYANCHHPVTTSCCKECSDCLYEGKRHVNGRKFAHPTDPCKECLCQNGTVQCSPKTCPPVKCSHPVQSQCCLQCKSGCSFNNSPYNNWQTFVHPLDPCKECICKKGNVTCKTKKCPPVKCKHPAKKQCCYECNDCFFNGVVVSAGPRFPDTTNECKECVCTNGSVKCQDRQCPPVYCENPVIDGCCPACNRGCLYSGRAYQIGEEFDHPVDPCQECFCMDGSVRCVQKSCSHGSCSDPVQARCCEECFGVCFYGNKEIQNGTSFPHLTDPCQYCTCQDGEIKCTKVPCPVADCPHPAPGECCPVCRECQFEGQVWQQGATFTHPENTCLTCHCQEGHVTCELPLCPPLNCPVQEVRGDECCPVCTGPCRYDNRLYTNGETFVPLSDKCLNCTCLDGQVFCKSVVCTHCPHPRTDPSQCCPLCSDCTYKDLDYKNGETFSSPDTSCQDCMCTNGSVNCRPVSCESPPCDNPVLLPGQCCPICRGCVVSGIRFEEGKNFTNPENPCEECMCMKSHVACKKLPCQYSCSHPLPDPCCPICDGCFFDNARYASGEEFHPDSCRTCVCKKGTVQCVSEVCPEVNCPLRTRLPGECCEVCRGCVFEGQEYENGRSWVSLSNPCMSCQCQGGVVTCSELHCIVPCANPQPVPGQCCPVCPNCEMNGKIYQSGEVFTPNGNPCDTCTCESGHLICITQQCPALVDCPRESIRPPAHGECCPTCAGFSSNCTRQHIGMTVQPSNDPCFTCECKEDFNWLCVREICPLLKCPPEELVQRENECCPKCNVCITEIEEDMYQNGEQWVPVLEPCLTCHCEYGQIMCHKSECPPVTCKSGEMEYRHPSECCSTCIPINVLSCHYGETIYLNDDEWQPDVCTKCQCKMGTVSCHTTRCLPLTCPSDEIPSVDPGHCCPKCIPKPATCITFGDPHYRTFDGAMIHFQGTCRYIMAADCDTGDFLVTVQNSDRGVRGVSWTESVNFTVRNTEVYLLQGALVLVNGKNITLPYFEDPILYIERTGTSVLVNTNIGVKVLWNGDSHAEVSVSGTYQGRTCGLCGNFNNFLHDDMRTKSGDITTSEAAFGNSWKTSGAQQPSCQDAEDIDPCSKGSYWTRKAANQKCSLLKGPEFAPCHALIPPEPYFASCVYDLCACSENDDCLCDILSTYSQECSQAGLVLNWRSTGLCAVGCPEESGLVFDECGPACPRTCENKGVSLRDLAAQCFKPCIPGCQCSADKVLHNGQCIHPDKCP